jgi:hypothetical protein
MRGIYLVYLFFVIYTHTYAQLILIAPTENYSPEIKFNSNYVKQHKIKKITCKVIYKPDNKVMEDKGLSKYYEFNTSGNLKLAYYTTLKGTEKVEKRIPAIYRRGKLIIPAHTTESSQYSYDTTFTYFFYDEKQNLIMQRTNIAVNIFNTTYYTYDTLANRLTKTITCRETNQNNSMHEFSLGIQNVLTNESFEYDIQSEKQFKKRYINDNGKVYKEGFVNITPLLRTEVYVFLVGSLRLTNFFNYQADGSIFESTFDSNAEDKIQYKCTYEYNEKQPVSQKIFKNQVKTHEINYLYDAETKLLRSTINRNFVENTIDILKLDYQFYE